MIEIVYKEETEAEETNIRLPRNVKQIGTGNGNRKVYIEDYVSGFIKIHPENEEEIRYGVLLGEIKRSGAESYVFVRGAVLAADVENVRFDDEIWTVIYENIKKYFSEGDVIGWFLNVPMMERERRMKLQKIHLDNFAGNDKICFYFDRTEKEEAIFSYDSGMMQKRHGYYVFYEKNPEMQSYMIENDERCKKEQKTSIKIKDGAIGRTKELTSRPAKAGGFQSFLCSASSFLVIAILVATVALMNNYGQMRKLKQSMQQMADGMVKQNNDLTNVIQANNEADTAKIEEVAGEVETTAEIEEPTEEKTTKAVEESTTASIEAQYNYYTVEQGETLSTICEKIYGTQNKKKDVMAANGITDENMIYVGQKIILP